MPLPKIQWRKPAVNKRLRAAINIRAANAEFVRDNTMVESPLINESLSFVPTAIRKVLQNLGTPEVKGASSPKEDAIGLLQLAAEIEHALMVQYLYAAASLSKGASSGIGPWSKLMTVATQEMGHLISVQNLLLLLGGPKAVHLGRDGIRTNSTKNPIPLVLESISESALAKFIVAEMPADATITNTDLRKRLADIKKLAKKSAGIEPHRVGAIYAKLFWLFQPDDKPIPPLNLTPDPELGLNPGWHIDSSDFFDGIELTKYQAKRDEWIKGSVVNFILDTPTDAESALSLITEISEQGEGLGDTHDSHFFEFLGLLDMWDQNKLNITSLPTSPFASTKPSFGPGTSIVTPYVRCWADLFDIRYNLLVLDLWHSIATPNPSTARTSLIAFAYENMHLIHDIITHLLQLGEDMGVKDAAPPFGLIYDDLPSNEEDRWQRHKNLLKQQEDIIVEIKKSQEFQDCSSGDCEILDFDGNICLGNIEQKDISRRNLIVTMTYNPI